MVYGSEAILLTDLEYGVPRVRAYNEQGAKASLEDAMDQLDEARDVALRRYHSCWVRGSGLQRRRLGTPPHLEQQGSPQAIAALGRTLRHRGGAPTGNLQAQNHRWPNLHQRMEH